MGDLMPSALAVALTPASDAQAPTWLRRDWREVEAHVQHSQQSQLESPFVATWPATRTSRAIRAAMRLIVLAICITACAVRAQVRAAQTVARLVAAWLALCCCDLRAIVLFSAHPRRPGAPEASTASDLSRLRGSGVLELAFCGSAIRTLGRPLATALEHGRAEWLPSTASRPARPCPGERVQLTLTLLARLVFLWCS